MFGLGILDAISGIAKKIISGIVDIFVFLFTHPAILLTIIIAIIAGYLYIKNAHHIYVLEQEIIQYEKEKIFWIQSKAIYESNIRLLTEVEKENRETLNKLQIINLEALKAKNRLNQANINARNKINNLEKYIKEAPPSDNGSVSPVLKNTVREIDKLRAERNSLWRLE